MLLRAWSAAILVVVFGSYFASAEPKIIKHPLPDFPQGEVRLTTGLMYEGRGESRRATGETYYRFLYYSGSGEEARELGELNFKTSGESTIKWGRIDSNDPGKGIATALYRVALDTEPFHKAENIKTYWTDDNKRVFQEKRLEGLSPLEAGRKTPSAKTFVKLGWELVSVDNGDISPQLTDDRQVEIPAARRWIESVIENSPAYGC